MKKNSLICFSAVVLLMFSPFDIAAPERKLVQQRITADETGTRNRVRGR